MLVGITDWWFVGGWIVVSDPNVVFWEVVIDDAIEGWLNDTVSVETMVSIVMLVGLSVSVEVVNVEPLSVWVEPKVDVEIEDISRGVADWKFVVSVVNVDGRFVEDFSVVSDSDVVFWEVAVDGTKSDVVLLVDDGIEEVSLSVETMSLIVVDVEPRSVWVEPKIGVAIEDVSKISNHSY